MLICDIGEGASEGDGAMISSAVELGSSIDNVAVLLSEIGDNDSLFRVPEMKRPRRINNTIGRNAKTNLKKDGK